LRVDATVGVEELLAALLDRSAGRTVSNAAQPVAVAVRSSTVTPSAVAPG
jgi:hypothetical protein